MSNQAECTKCNKVKHKEFKQTLGYVDEQNRRWIHRRCPDCSSRKQTKPPQEAPKRKRNCLRCGGPLVINYFYHPDCLALKEQAVGYTYLDAGGPQWVSAKASR